MPGWPVLRLAYHLAGTGHISVLDAAYFTVETVTTIGYGDFSFHGQAPWLIASAIAPMLAGATFVAVFFSLLRTSSSAAGSRNRSDGSGSRG